MKTLHCSDAGFNYQGVIRANTEEEVLNQAAQYAPEVQLPKRVGTEKFQRTGIYNNWLTIETSTQTINQTLARRNFIFFLQMLLSTLKQYPYYTRLKEL